MEKSYRGYRDLKVYQLAYELALQIHEETKRFPKEEGQKIKCCDTNGNGDFK